MKILIICIFGLPWLSDFLQYSSSKGLFVLFLDLIFLYIYLSFKLYCVTYSCFWFLGYLFLFLILRVYIYLSWYFLKCYLFLFWFLGIYVSVMTFFKVLFILILILGDLFMIYFCIVDLLIYPFSEYGRILLVLQWCNMKVYAYFNENHSTKSLTLQSSMSLLSNRYFNDIQETISFVKNR